jgi:hypothetical protein
LLRLRKVGDFLMSPAKNKVEPVGDGELVEVIRSLGNWLSDEAIKGADL